MTPRQIRLGRTAAPADAISLAASDSLSSWVLGAGEPVATIRAPAAELLLLLWGRLPADDQAITWDGDRDRALVTLGGSLVP
jgi:MDMPI C-terminal domain